MRHHPLSFMLLAALVAASAAHALAATNPDDPPPLAPVREPAPEEPAPPRLFLAAVSAAAEADS